MSKYSERLNRLKRETNEIKAKRKKKSLKSDQQIVYNFIHGVTQEAKYYIETKDITVILKKGDENKGFMHIIERHYCKGCKGEISSNDILNFFMMIERGIEASSNNPPLIAFRHLKGEDRHFIILNPTGDEKTFVVSFYNEG
jgi:hypothetical protein